MKAWLSRIFERIIGEPKHPEAPAPSVYGTEANRAAEEKQKANEMETEIATAINTRRPGF